MERTTPPSLRFTRQWTQTTSFDHHTLSRVAYPSSPQNASPTSSASPVGKGDDSSISVQSHINGGSSRRHPWQTEASSPLPSQPSPLADPHRTPTRKAPHPMSTRRTSGGVASVNARVGTSVALRDAEEAGRHFWQQQAQRLEEVNAALRRELNAVYHAVRNMKVEEHPLHGAETRSHASTARYTSAVEARDAERRFAAVVAERNMARMELAQERELNFLLRHRLREMEIAMEQQAGSRQRLLRQQESTRGDSRLSSSGRAASTRAVSAASLKASAGPAPSSSHLRSRSRASSSSSSATSSSARASSCASAAASSSASSPRVRSATRRHASQRSSRERSDGQTGVSLPRSTFSHQSDAARVPRGYERLRRRAEARAGHSSLSAASSSASSSSRAAALMPVLSVRSASPLSPDQEVETGAISTDAISPPPPQLHASGAYSIAVAPSTTGGAREVEDKRALLTSLLAAHSTSSVEPLARHTFRSRLFSSTDEKDDEEHDEIAAEAPKEKEAPATQPNASEWSAAAAFVARPRFSSTSTPLPRTSPSGAGSLSDGPPQRSSSNGSWLSVSVTTEEGNPSRSLSLRDRLSENTAWSAAFRSFSL